MLVPVTGSIEVVAKAADVDEDGALELVRLAIYESLSELAERDRYILEADMDAFVAKAAKARSVLVRSFVQKRMDGEDVEDVIKAAAELTLMEELVSKDVIPDNKSTRYWDARSMATGQFAPASGGGPLSRGGRNLMSVLTRGKERTNPYKGHGDKWAETSTSERLAGAGDILASMNNPEARAAGYAAQFIGEVGPEAEKVLGRHLRRTAYRYRGTERKPNENTAASVKAAGAIASQVSDGNEQVEAALHNLVAQRGTVPPARGINAHYLGREFEEFTPDQRRLAVQGDAAAATLMRQLPTQTSAAISREAGRTAPSVGIMIDADGDVVSESQGFNGDHYVPFDLKNLKRLNGGQYARTRTMGGPTSEDIYTGLLSNARQVQVVSNSGVFTLEFDPSIRGGRRYNDKAKQMISRYTELLKAVDSNKIAQRELPLKDRKELRTIALRRARGDQKQANTIYRELMQEKVFEQNFIMDDDEIKDQAMEDARAEIEATPSGMKGVNTNVNTRASEIERELRAKRRDSQAKMFQLDGEGYAAALDALKEEFPFYIRSVRHEALPEFVDRRRLSDPKNEARVRQSGGVDRGYVNTSAGQLQMGDKIPKPQDGANADENASVSGTGSGTSSGGSGAGSTNGASSTPRDRKLDLVKNNVPAKNTKPLTLDLDRSPELASELTTSIRQIRSYADIALVAEDDAKAGKHDLDYWDNSPDVVTYFLRKNDTPQKVMAALKDPATAEKVLAALSDLEKMDILNEAAHSLEAGGKKAVSRLLAAANLQAPFGPRPPKNFLVMPNDDNPKPPLIGEIVELGNKIDNYDNYLDAASEEDKDLAALINEMSDDPKAAAKQVRDYTRRIKADLDALVEDPFEAATNESPNDLDDFKKDPGTSAIGLKLQRLQTAWAYTHARSLLEQNQDIAAKIGGDEGKAEAPAQGEVKDLKKRLLVQKADDLQAVARLVHPDSAVGRVLHRHLVGS